MMEPFIKDQPDPEEAVKAIGRTIPLGRVGQPEDIAQAVYFLASAGRLLHYRSNAGGRRRFA